MLKEFTSYAEKCSEIHIIPMQVFQSTIDSIQVCMNLHKQVSHFFSFLEIFILKSTIIPYLKTFIHQALFFSSLKLSPKFLVFV